MTSTLKLLFLFLLVSCVGTVEDAKVKLNSLFEEDKITLNFSGIDQAKAISHNKVEIEFTPSGEVSPNLKYQLYINNSLAPIEINPDSLDKAANGRVRYLVDGLTINSKYKLRLRLKNSLTQAMSKNEKEVTVDTFDNKTADFKGITSVTKVNGQSESTIRVDWVSAIMEGSTTTGPWDPLYYEITIIGNGGISNINNNNYTGSDRRRIRVPPALTDLSPFNYTKWTHEVIGSLQPNTQYHVQVRAINRLYNDFLNLPGTAAIPVDKELNTKFLTIKTDPATGVFDFTGDSFRAQAGPGAQSKTRIVNTWLPAGGSYVGYRLFYIECSGPNCNTETEVLGTDLLTDDAMEDIVAGTLPGGRFVESNVLTSPTTSYVLTGLTEYKWYQLRMVACRTSTCSRASGDAIPSPLRAVRTAPILAPFAGLTSVLHPDSSLAVDQVSLQFDLPDLLTGYADTMEVFCIDPASVTEAQNSLNYIKFSNDPSTKITGSTVSQCNQLSLCGPNSTNCEDGAEAYNYTVSSGTNIRVKGIKTDGTKYCFAAAPAIREEVGHEMPTSDHPQDWIIRCIAPEVKTPTIAQFPGAANSCGAVNNSLTITWPKPVAGIYSAYRVLWRKIEGSDSFSFSAATTDVAAGNINNPSPANPYSASPIVDPDTLTYTINNLRPGTRYKVGVLTQTTAAGPIKWSEFNTNVRDCVTPMPKFKFDEWTRIFAIGPKTDGRYPYLKELSGSGTTRAYSPSAYVYESLNNDGIPYEVTLDASNDLDLDARYFKPPGIYSGSYSPSGFADDFDGAPANLGNSTNLVASSNSGIVSLAWKDVTLDFLTNEFKDCQINAGETPVNTYCYNNGGSYNLPTQKKIRRYGYKVFRSADNRLSWQDITKTALDADTATGSSLVYAKDYKYLKRSDLPESTDRMAFFTDYSVKAIKADPTSKSRARIYWYKIVPYFDNKSISLDSSQSGLPNPPNEIKVILPPDNMALVHRWMSNRQACNELERTNSIDKAANYTCGFNGFGAKAKGFPWNPNNTVVDLGGHLLIDRFELGCNFTRGDADSTPVSNGNSHFERTSSTFPGWTSQLPTFKGYATDNSGNDATAKKFMGCATKQWSNDSITLLGVNNVTTDSILSNHRRIIHGDCISMGSMVMASSSCASIPENADYYRWSFPGAFMPRNSANRLDPNLDCALGTADEPTTFDIVMSPTFRKNLVIQSEFAAVLHHASPEAGMVPNFEGPTGNILNVSNREVWGKPVSCHINLAAIGADSNWIARWVNAGDLGNVKGQTNIVNSTMAQVKANGNLYNPTSFKAPGSDFTNESRFVEDTKIGRIISSNAAKLPPITGLTVEVASQLCNAYDIEVGFSNNGTNFLSITLPKTKRLLGRQELISASAWPDAGFNGYTENFNYAEVNGNQRIRYLEANLCVGADKSTGLEPRFHGSNMLASIPRVFWDGTTIGTTNGPALLLTGSSVNEGAVNSEMCVSKYGVQDLVGNAAEITTDRLFCDYGDDKLYFGRLDTGQGYAAQSVQVHDYDGTEGEHDIFWLKAKVIQETAGGDVEIVNGTSLQGKMWADISPKSGYCSIVDSQDPGTGYPGLSNRFRDANNNFTNIFKPDGTLNSDMILDANPIYQPSVDKLRNGDGYFLSFGNNTPGPYLQRSNSWAINKEGFTYAIGMALGPYFNPIIGIPMKCPGSTCDDSEDNMLASTTYFVDIPDSPKPGVTPSILRFPAGNSQLMNLGISETSYDRGTTTFPINFENLNERRGIEHVIYEIRIKLDGTRETKRMPMREWAIHEFGSYTNAGLQYFSKMSFVVPRNSALQLLHGADARSQKAGRYSVNTLVATPIDAKRSPQFTAARCGVLIED